MKVCQIGLGRWGRNHARVLNELKMNGEIDELYFYDIDPYLRNTFAKMHNAVAIESIDNLDVDAVDIVVPANLHFKVAESFVERGIKTFIEKPITDSIEDAMKLSDIALDPERDIMVGHIFRFHSGVKFANSQIQKGAIGEVSKIDIRRLAFGYPRSDNGVIFSLAIHDLDLFCLFNSEQYPNEISTIMNTIRGPTEDHSFISLKFDNNVVGVAEESWMSPAIGKIRSCSIMGSNGEIKFNFDNPSQVTVNSIFFDSEGKVVDNGQFTHSIEFKEPLKEELHHFINQSKANKPYEVGPEIGIRAVKLCEAALDSGKSGKTIYLQD